MREILEIIAAMLAAFGVWSLLHTFRDWLLFPARIRRRVNAAVYIDNGASDIAQIAAYVKTLKKEGKIYSERLIILAESDIIKEAVLNDCEFDAVAVREKSDVAK